MPLTAQEQFAGVYPHVCIYNVNQVDAMMGADNNSAQDLLLGGSTLLVLETDAIATDAGLPLFTHFLRILGRWQGPPACIITIGEQPCVKMQLLLGAKQWEYEIDPRKCIDFAERQMKKGKEVIATAQEVASQGQSILCFDLPRAKILAGKLGVPFVDLTDPSSLDIFQTMDGSKWNKAGSAVVYVDMEKGSGPFKPYRLGLVISCPRRFFVFDDRYGRYISRPEYMNGSIMLAHAEYAGMAGCPMVMTYDQYDFPNSFEFETFSSDMFLAAYRVVSDRPHIKQTPSGTGGWEDFVDKNLPADETALHIVQLHLRRLEIMGAVKETETGYCPGAVGQLAHDIATECAAMYRGSFVYACSVAMLNNSNLVLSARLRRLGLRLVMLSCLSTSWLTVVKSQAEQDNVQDLCIGPGKALVAQGEPWALLGLWEKARKMTKGFRGAEGHYRLSQSMTVNVQAAREILGALNTTEKMLGILQKHKAEDDLRRDLSLDEVVLLYRYLARALSDDVVVVFKDKTKGAIHFRSGRPVKVDRMFPGTSLMYETKEHDDIFSPPDFSYWLVAHSSVWVNAESQEVGRIPLLIPASHSQYIASLKRK